MATWQIVLFVFFLLLPFALLYDFWPDRERLDAEGRPLPRDWERQVTHPPADDQHH